MAKSTPSNSPSDRRSATQRYRAGVAAFDRGDFAESARQLASLADAGGPFGCLARVYIGRAHLALGRAALARGEHAAAVEQLDAARRVGPQTPELLDDLALAHAGRGDGLEAARWFERAAEIGTASIRRTIRLAWARWRGGQIAPAMSLLRELMRSAPMNAEPVRQLAVMHAERGEHAEAIALLQEAVVLAPADAEAHRMLGLVQAAAGQPAEAAAALADALRLRPGDASIRAAHDLARRCLPAGEATPPATSAAESATGEQSRAALPAGAEAADGRADSGVLPRLCRQFVDDPELAEAFLDDPSNEEAELSFVDDALRKAVAERPEYADVWHVAARVRARRGLAEEALEMDGRALHINPNYVRAMLHRAQLWTELSRDHLALDELKRALAAGADYPDVHFNLGELHRRAGRFDLARRAYERALQLNQSYAAARQRLAGLTAA